METHHDKQQLIPSDDLKMQKTVKTLMAENADLKAALTERDRLLASAGIANIKPEPANSSRDGSVPGSQDYARRNRFREMREEIVTESVGSGGGSARRRPVDTGSHDPQEPYSEVEAAGDEWDKNDVKATEATYRGNEVSCIAVTMSVIRSCTKSSFPLSGNTGLLPLRTAHFLRFSLNPHIAGPSHTISDRLPIRSTLSCW